MNQASVTLDEVFGAAAVRGASLVPETSGYLALAIGDATSRLPYALDERAVTLTTEGNVGMARRGEVIPPPQAARALRDVLARLLAASTGTMPGLAGAARPREESERGVEAVVEEIEAALIPVNRAAARRALARLARETLKTKDAGRLKVRPPVRAEPAAAAPPRAAPEPPRAAAPEPARVAPEPPRAAPEPPKPAPEPVAVVVEPRRAAPEPPRAAPEPPRTAPEPPRAAPEPARAARIEAPASTHLVEASTPTPEVPVLLVDDAGTPPPDASREPTPTTIDMPSVEMNDAEARTELTVMTEHHHGEPAGALPPAEAPDEDPYQLAEREIHVSSDAPPVVYEPVREAVAARTVAAPITPPFALATAPGPAPRAAPAAKGGTRADDLLSRFGASRADETDIQEAAACLRRIAGIEATPPPARVQIRLPPPSPPVPAAPSFQIPPDWETPLTPRVRARRAVPSVGFTLVVLAAGLAGGAALVRLRPDLFGVARAIPAPQAAAPAPDPAPARRDPSPAPAEAAPSTQPAGAPAPSWTDHLGGTRADRNQRGGSR
jgi:hypothetical protein